MRIEDDPDPDLLHDRIDNARYWLDKAESIMAANGFQDPGVATLRRGILATYRRMAEYEAEEKE